MKNKYVQNIGKYIYDYFPTVRAMNFDKINLTKPCPLCRQSGK